MQRYRIYSVNSSPKPGDPSILGLPRIVECDNDAEAIRQAREFMDGHDVEVWEGSRLVIAIKSNDVK